MTEPEVDEASVDQITSAIVADTIARYRGVAVGVLVLLAVVIVAPTRSPVLTAFDAFGFESPSVSTVAPLAPPAPPSTAQPPPAPSTTTTVSSTTTSTVPSTTTTVRTQPTVPPSSTTSTTSTTTTTAPPPTIPTCRLVGIGC